MGVFPAALVLLATAAGPSLADHPVRPPGKISKPFSGYKSGKQGKPDYSYAYGIDDKYSGVKLDVKERRKGYQTEGQYVSKLPDGRKQTTSYYVNGKSGFVADVRYDGVAEHPIPVKKPVKPAKYAPLKPHKPAEIPYKPAEIPYKPVEIPYKPVEIPYKPIAVPYKPIGVPNKPLPYVPQPVDVDADFDITDCDDDSYATYDKGYPKKTPFQGYVQQDIYPGYDIPQRGSARDPYSQSSKAFQQQFFNWRTFCVMKKPKLSTETPALFNHRLIEVLIRLSSSCQLSCAM